VNYLLDTNSCIDHLRRGAGSTVTTRLAGMASNRVVLCSVVVAELLYGARRSANAARALARSKRFAAGSPPCRSTTVPPMNTVGSDPIWRAWACSSGRTT